MGPLDMSAGPSGRDAPSSSVREALRVVTANAPQEMTEDRSEWCASDYEILSVISASPVRSILRARCRLSGEEVCLKVYDKRNLVDEGKGRTGAVMSRKQVLREIRIHSQANHEGIVKLYGAFETDRAYFMVFELCECSLRDILDTQGILKTKHAKLIVARLLEALSYLHANAIMHGDVNPNNILIDVNGDPKLTDFSLAMDLKLEQPFQPRGCLSYCAPEVVETVGDEVPRSISTPALHPCMYDTKADVWAAGVCAFELLQGHSLFDPYSRDTCLAQIKSFSVDLSGLSERQMSFVSSALIENSASRPTSSELASHPWLQGRCQDQTLTPSRGWVQLPSLATTTYWRKLLHI